MIATQNISLSYSGKPLFKNVNIKFTAGNCYGIIGANGTGKSTFLKVLSGELEPTTGDVVITPGERMAVLRQNHFEFDEYVTIPAIIDINELSPITPIAKLIPVPIINEDIIPNV